MPIPPYLKPVYDAVMTAPRSLPAPWQLVSTAAVGGLTDVGFIGDSDHLLVLSHQGRGIYDCRTGERVARDRDENYPFDTRFLTAPAFDRFAGETVHTAGLHGGGLPLGTADGWITADFIFDWPERIITISPPGHSVYSARYNKPSDVHVIASESEIRAFGFSPSGRAFVIGMSSDLIIISRSP